MLLWSCVECSKFVSAAGRVVIYGGEVRAVASVRAAEGVFAPDCQFASVLQPLANRAGSLLLLQEPYRQGSPTRGRLPGRGRVPGLERRVAAQRQTGARRPAPRAQPRCKPSVQRRPDGPKQSRDPTKRPGLAPQEAAPRPCPVAPTTSGAATSAIRVRTPCGRPNVSFVARRRRGRGSGRFRTAATSSSI